MRAVLRVLVVAGAFVLPPAALAAGGFAAGSDGLGDPMFPLAGNGGYDVTNYSLTLDYTPSGNRLVGTVVITARATQNLSRFDLDFRMHDVTRVLVDGAAASFGYAKDQELVVTPAAGLVQGKSFTATVDYAGTPLVVTDPDQSIEGWVPTDDGAFVVNEPQGSPGWYPANDNPPVYYRGGITLTGAAREDRRPSLLPAASRLGDAESVRNGHDAPVHRACGEGKRAGPDAVLQGVDLPGGEAGARQLVAVARAAGP
jgi:hypothetical protein